MLLELSRTEGNMDLSLTVKPDCAPFPELSASETLILAAGGGLNGATVALLPNYKTTLVRDVTGAEDAKSFVGTQQQQQQQPLRAGDEL